MYALFINRIANDSHIIIIYRLLLTSFSHPCGV